MPGKGKPFTTGPDPRRKGNGKRPNVSRKVRAIIGDDGHELIAKVLAQACLTGVLSFDVVRKSKIRRIDSGKLRKDEELSAKDWRQCLIDNGYLFAVDLPEDEVEMLKEINVKLGGVAHG